jgi:hypothetical protein
MQSNWKTVNVRRPTYDVLVKVWESDSEAQRRGQRFTPWLDMVLVEVAKTKEQEVSAE